LFHQPAIIQLSAKRDQNKNEITTTGVLYGSRALGAGRRRGIEGEGHHPGIIYPTNMPSAFGILDAEVVVLELLYLFLN